MKASHHFLVHAAGTFPANEYRIVKDQVQFRIIGNGQAGSWLTLDGNDVLMHLSLKTSVGEWLMRVSPAVQKMRAAA